MKGKTLRLALTGLLALGLLGATGLVYLGAGSGSPPPSPGTALPEGREVFLAKGCNGCHTLEGLPGRAGLGPDLTGLAARAGDRVPGISAEEYVRQSIREPQAFVVPEFRDGFVRMPVLPLSEGETDALVRFLLEPGQAEALGRADM